MRHSTALPVLTALVLLLAGGCTTPAPESTAHAKPRRDTYVVLLDLSDRLLEPGQPARDTALLGQVLRRFVTGARQKLYAGSADRLKVVVAEQGGTPAAVLAAAQAPLAIDLGHTPLLERRQVGKAARALQARVTALYGLAAQGHHRQDYAGAELWHYFAERLALDFSPEPAMYEEHAYLLVLTDGYLDFENYTNRRQDGQRSSSTRFVSTLARQGAQWPATFAQGRLGLLPFPAAPALRQVQTLVAEIHPHSEYHFDILQATWQQWLHESGMPVPRLLPRTDLAALRAQLDQW